MQQLRLWIAHLHAIESSGDEYTVVACRHMSVRQIQGQITNPGYQSKEIIHANSVPGIFEGGRRAAKSGADFSTRLCGRQTC
jgi:hypothetical protein